MVVEKKAKNSLLRLAVPGLSGVILVAMAVYALAARDTSLERLRNTGVIRIGYAIEAPYAFLEPDGEVTGESPELARRVAEQLGIARVEWRLVEFNMLIAELEAGRIDVIAAGMFITPERARRVNFSEPSFHVRQGLLVASGNPRGLHAYDQAVAQPEIRLAVLSGSVEEQLLHQMGMSLERMAAVPDALTGLAAVETGLVDGLALSAPTIQWMALQNQLGRAELAEPFEQPHLANQEKLGYGGFAFRKRDTQLLSAWNDVLATLVGSPEHLALIEEFGLTAADLPGDVTTLEIIQP